MPLNSRVFLKSNLMYFQRLFYEYGRLYVSEIKDSQQICPLSANEYGEGGGSCPLMHGGGGLRDGFFLFFGGGRG